jgi:hypothetical protein
MIAFTGMGSHPKLQDEGYGDEHDENSLPQTNSKSDQDEYAHARQHHWKCDADGHEGDDDHQLDEAKSVDGIFVHPALVVSAFSFSSGGSRMAC